MKSNLTESAASPIPHEQYRERNSAVLKVSPDRFPKTLNDLDLDDLDGRNANWWTSPKRDSTAKTRFFHKIGAKFQFHPYLAKPGPRSRHVYVVCRPHSEWVTSTQHWSLYTQGHFYHLTIDDPASCFVESAASASENIGRRSKTILKHQDLSSQKTSDSNDKQMKLALIAYQVGKTIYTHDEIYNLAAWVIKDMPIYKRFSVNCQGFVYSLMKRIVMTKRDFATFVGNKFQLVEWDRARSDSTRQSDNGHQSCIQNGFEISKGVDKVSRVFSYQFIAEINDSFSMNHDVATAIRKLYRQGPLAAGAAYVQNGHSNMYINLMRQSAAEFADGGRIFKRVVQEFSRDIRDRKWEDALKGRRETLKEFRDRAVKLKEQGVNSLIGSE